MIEKVTIGTISAVIHLPPEQSDTVVILLPGYLDSKEYTHLVTLAEDLKEKGYVAVRFDLAGTWEGGDNLSEYTVSRHVEDLKKVITFMLNRHAFKSVFVGGHSRGGFIAVICALEDKRISGVFAIESPYALLQRGNEERMKRWEKEGSRTFFMDIPGSEEKKEFRMPYIHANIEDAQKHNLLEEIPNLHTPLLLIAGEKDHLITPDDVKKIYDKANEPKKFVVIEGVGHCYRLNETDIQKVNNEVMAWVQDLVETKKYS
jgi:alpha-beta hydrolase superfamily lysophospholipase